MPKPIPFKKPGLFREPVSDRPPFVHTVFPVYVPSPSGIEVPCDGPNLLALDDDGRVICSTCNTRVVRTGKNTRE